MDTLSEALEDAHTYITGDSPGHVEGFIAVKEDQLAFSSDKGYKDDWQIMLSDDTLEWCAENADDSHTEADLQDALSSIAYESLQDPGDDEGK